LAIASLYGLAFLSMCTVTAAPVAPLVAEVALEEFLDGPVTYVAFEKRIVLLSLQNMD
jgi:hypothetical protein